MDETEFRKACLAGDAAAVRAGIAAGCDPVSGNAKGMTPLMLAVWQRDAAVVVDALLDADADPSMRQPTSGWSATTYAAVDGRVASLAILLARGGSLADD